MIYGFILNFQWFICARLLMSRNTTISRLSITKYTLNSPILNIAASHAASKFSFSNNIVSNSLSSFLRIDESKHFSLQKSQFHHFVDKVIDVNKAIYCSIVEQDQSYSSLLTYDATPRCLINVLFSNSNLGAIVTSGPLSCTDCTFNAVNYGDGQGVIKTTAELELNNVLFQSCLYSGTGTGSVIDFNSNAMLTISSATFTSCSGTPHIINIQQGSFTINNTIFKSCASTNLVYATSSVSASITYSDFEVSDPQTAIYTENLGQVTLQNIIIRGTHTQAKVVNLAGTSTNLHVLENITVNFTNPPPYMMEINTNFSLKTLLIEATTFLGNYYVFSGNGHCTNDFQNSGYIYVNGTGAENVHKSESLIESQYRYVSVIPVSSMGIIGELPVLNITGGTGGTGSPDSGTSGSNTGNNSETTPGSQNGSTLTPVAITLIVILCIVIAFGIFGAVFVYVRLCRRDVSNEIFDPTIGPAFP